MTPRARWRLSVLTVLIVLGLTALVMWRVPVLAWSLRHGLALWDVDVVKVSGMRLDTTHLAVDEVVFDIAGQGRLSRIERLRLRYSLPAMRLLSLEADSVELALPPPAPPAPSAAPSPSAAQSFANIVAQLRRFPLQSLRLERIALDEVAPFSLVWRREGPVQYGVLRREDLLLTADLHGESGQPLTISLRAHQGERELAALQADVSVRAGASSAVAIQGYATAGAVEALKLAQVRVDPDARLELSLVGELPDDVSLWGHQAAHFDTRLALRAARLSMSELSLHGNDVELRGDLVWGPGQLQLHLEPGAQLRSAVIRGEGLEFSDPRIELVRAADLSWQFAEHSLGFTLPALRVVLPAARLGETHLVTELAVTGIRGEIAPLSAHYSARAALNAASLQLRHPSQWLPQLALSSTWRLTAQSLTARGQLNGDRGKSILAFESKHAFNSGRGSAELSTGRMIFAGENAGFGQWFSDWPFAVDLRRGLSKSDVQLRWFPHRGSMLLRGAFQQRLQNLGGFAGDIGFFGVSADLQGSFSYPDQLLIARGAELSARQLDIGLPVEDIQLRFGAALRAPTGDEPARHKLHLQRFAARLFDGMVSADEHLLLRHRPPGRVTFHVDGLDIEELLDAMALKGVAATGRVSGTLPLRIDEAGVTMRAGRLAAEAPGGVFRYRGGAGVVQGSTVGVVQQMLGNYHYDTLSADIDYGAKGDLVLQLKLDGANPDVDGGRRIKLNMTVEDNIPTLLRSLQAGRAIEQWVDRRYKKGA